MSTIVKTGWLKDKNGERFAPKTLASQTLTSDGVPLENSIEDLKNTLNTHTHNWNSLEDKPFYEGELEEYYPMPEQTISGEALQWGQYYIAGSTPIEIGSTYEVIFNGEPYTVECYQGPIGPSVGDQNLQEYPFFVFDGGYASGIVYNVSEEPITIAIKGYSQEIKKLERKFVEGIAGMDVEGNIFEYNGNTYTSFNGAEIFNDYTNNKAYAPYSHAEGYNTIAIGSGAHAEGGNAEAVGNGAHAEGSSTKARGTSSHAEGSHTIASGNSQHVQGQYNIEDTENKYAHIVGNGNPTIEGKTFSNAHTLDWNGNAWYQGNIKVGGTSYDDASEVALKSDIIQSNWEQNDETTTDYIQNRPFYDTGKYEENVLLENSSTFTFSGTQFFVSPMPVLENDKTYRVVLNDQEFFSQSFIGTNGYIALGSKTFNKTNEWVDGELPFFVFDGAGLGLLSVKPETFSSSITISIYQSTPIINQIERKYIEKHLVGRKSEVKDYSYEDKIYNSKEGAEVFNAPSNIAIGEFSHSEGVGTLALGNYAHAEGTFTEAIGRYSHAEGYATKTIGDGSHAEGSFSEAIKDDSHAEGCRTKASGKASHAEGYYTEANSSFLHVEGMYNLVEDYQKKYLYSSVAGTAELNGDMTVYIYETSPTLDKTNGTLHSGNTREATVKDLKVDDCFSYENTPNTQIENYRYVRELVSTKVDEETGATLHTLYILLTHIEEDTLVAGKYLHIVGNGTKEEKRSNAHTLEVDGTAWYAGDIYVGSTSGKTRDEGSKKLATEDYVNQQSVVIQMVTWEADD